MEDKARMKEMYTRMDAMCSIKDFSGMDEYIKSLLASGMSFQLTTAVLMVTKKVSSHLTLRGLLITHATTKAMEESIPDGVRDFTLKHSLTNDESDKPDAHTVRYIMKNQPSNKYITRNETWN